MTSRMIADRPDVVVVVHDSDQQRHLSAGCGLPVNRSASRHYGLATT